MITAYISITDFTEFFDSKRNKRFIFDHFMDHISKESDVEFSYNENKKILSATVGIKSKNNILRKRSIGFTFDMDELISEMKKNPDDYKSFGIDHILIAFSSFPKEILEACKKEINYSKIAEEYLTDAFIESRNFGFI